MKVQIKLLAIVVSTMSIASCAKDPSVNQSVMQSDTSQIVTVLDSVLADQMTRMDATVAFGAIMRVETGEIVAMSNWEEKDGTVCKSYNHLLEDRVDPGSAFSVISYAALLEDGFVTSKSIIDARSSTFVYHGAIIKDPVPVGVVKAEDAVALRSNTAIVKMVTRAYESQPQKFLDTIERFGWNGVRNVKDHIWSKVSLAREAYGYEAGCSPMNFLVFYNAIANNGLRPDYGRICSEETALQVQRTLEKAVENAMQPNDVRVAGMTGLARKYENHKYEGNSFRVCFVGYFPADAPKYSCMVMMETKPDALEDYKPDVAAIVGPVVSSIAEYMYRNNI